METIKSLLDAAKAATNTDSDYGLAKALGLHKARISAYYSGKETPNEFVCLKIAQALGRSYEEVSAIVRIEAEKDETRREVWRDYLKRLGGYAAGIMLSLLSGLLFVTFIVTTTPEAQANQELTKPILQEYKLCDFGIGASCDFISNKQTLKRVLLRLATTLESAKNTAPTIRNRLRAICFSVKTLINFDCVS